MRKLIRVSYFFEKEKKSLSKSYFSVFAHDCDLSDQILQINSFLAVFVK